MSKTKYVKQYFEKRPVGTGYYADHVHAVPEDKLEALQKAGYCRDTTQTLPADLPGREAFLAAGIETAAEIKALEDPTEIKGIGDSTARELAEWFAGGSDEADEEE